MNTPAQTMFPKKPKVFSTPLRPISDGKIITPLMPKIADEPVEEIEQAEPEAPKRRGRKPE